MSLSISHPGRCCIYPFSSGAPDSVGWCLQARLHGKKVSLNTRITRCGDAACHARYLGTETTAEVRGDSCLSSHTHSWALCLLSGTQGGAARPIRHFHFVCIMNPCNLNTGSDECYYRKRPGHTGIRQRDAGPAMVSESGMEKYRKVTGDFELSVLDPGPSPPLPYCAMAAKLPNGSVPQSSYS